MIPISKLNTILAFFGFIIFIGSIKATITTFDPNIGGATSTGNIRNQIIGGAIYAFVFFLILLKLEKFLPFLCKNILLIAFLIIPILSVTWSVSPEATLRRGVALLGTSFFAIYIAFAIHPERAIRILTAAYALTTIASLIVIFLLPTYGTHQFGEYAGLWRGLFAGKNEFGATMAMAVILLFLCPAYTTREWILKQSLIVLCLILLYKSESRTAWVSLLIVGTTAPLFWWISGRGAKTAIRALILLTAAALASFLIAKHSETLLEMMGKDPTLTGRTGVWESTLERAMERPLLGYGYRAYWTPENKRRLRATENWSDGIGHAHNTYLDLMAELGLLGVVFFLGLLLILVFRIVTRAMHERNFINTWAMAGIMFIIVRGFAESTILQHADINWVYFVYFFALFSIPYKPNEPVTKIQSKHQLSF